MCNRMMCKGKSKSAVVSLAAAVLLTCCLAQTIDCYRLRKTERREGRKEADSSKTIGVQEGKIVFGRVFKKGSGLESQVIDGTEKPSSNASMEGEAAYQADFADWSQGQVQVPSSMEAAWKVMSPSLQCGADQMKFSAVGPGALHFEVEQRNASPMPLSQVPGSCGYGMQRNPLGLVLLVPYDGCNVAQVGGSYVLPLRWQGIPVLLWCRKPADQQNPQHQTPWYPPSSHVHPAMSQVHPQVYSVVPQVQPQMRNHQDNSLSRILQSYYFLPYANYPSVPEPTTTKKPDMPKPPVYPFFHPFYRYFPHTLPVTTAAPIATAKPATAPPSVVPLPFYHHFPWPGLGPLQATAKPISTVTKPQHPHSPYMPFLPQYPFLPPYPQHPTSKPETTTLKIRPQPPQFTYMPFPYHSFLPPYPPPTTTTQI